MNIIQVFNNVIEYLNYQEVSYKRFNKYPNPAPPITTNERSNYKGNIMLLVFKFLP